MPSTYSSLKVQLMATGENNTTWGDVTNVNLGTALEEAIVGSADVTFASANVTLTLTDTNASQTARNMRLLCTGTTGGSTRNLVVPSIEKSYIVRNSCADNILVKTAAGSGITVPPGTGTWVYVDGTNVVDAITYLTELTVGTLAVGNGIIANLTAVNLSSSNVTITGGSITGITDLAVADGGTGQSSYTNGQLLIGNTTGNTLTKATLTAGSGITITNGTGSITIAATGFALTNWTEAVNTSAPNATVPVVSFTATNAATNVDAAIVPKGSGAFTLAVADGTVTGGNKRGTYAVDLQSTRSGATQVASGDSSFLAGANSIASGQFATVAGGSGSTASGTYATVAGGRSNTADGTVSIVVGGAYGTTRGAIGLAHGSNPISNTLGLCQFRRFVLGRETTAVTATVLTANVSGASATNQVNLVNNSAFFFRGSVIANVTGGGNTKGWTIEGVIKRGANAASTALVGTATVTSNYADAGASTWTVTVTADTTNGCLAVTVTGQAATTIRWVANIETTEVTY